MPMVFKQNLLGVFLILVLFCNLSLADDKNITMQEQASICLNNSQKIISNLESSGFGVNRPTDMYNEAKLVNEAQLTIAISNPNRANFEGVIKKCGEISRIEELAFEAQDSVNSLKQFYSESILEGTDTTSIDLLMSEIQIELQNERYERVLPLIDNAYNEISRIRAENTQLTLFYKTTASTFYDFLYKHRIEFIVILSLLLLFFLLYRITIRKMILNKKIQKLELRKETLKELIKKVQKGYFQDGNVSEGSYNIRIKNFAEMVRDLDRQIPLLKEEYFKLSRKVEK